MNILILVSGNGTNLQALIDAEKAGRFSGGGSGPSGKIAAVLSDRPGVYALERAKLAGIPALTVIPDKALPKPERRQELSDRILTVCRERDIGLIIYAGFISILTGELFEAYAGRMINVHPSLLPKFGGQGMYGERVHKAVLAAGEKESGCTVHIVDAEVDAGPILIQRKVPVLAGDTADTLAERIHKEEHSAIVDGVVIMIKKLAVIIKGEK
ncbi:phosphoribosylglycinamide formyltransferase [Spirochaetia bacterium]|nr:phosphoribosylglycinamide formyltransferase [Spirochaetia bacterium]